MRKIASACDSSAKDVSYAIARRLTLKLYGMEPLKHGCGATTARLLTSLAECRKECGAWRDCPKERPALMRMLRNGGQAGAEAAYTASEAARGKHFPFLKNEVDAKAAYFASGADDFPATDASCVFQHLTWTDNSNKGHLRYFIAGKRDLSYACRFAADAASAPCQSGLSA